MRLPLKNNVNIRTSARVICLVSTLSRPRRIVLRARYRRASFLICCIDMSKQHLTDIPLASFEFPEPLLRGIQDAGFHLCTPIQARCLPIALAGHDVAGQAQTGTGKTTNKKKTTKTQKHTQPKPPEHT